MLQKRSKLSRINYCYCILKKLKLAPGNCPGYTQKLALDDFGWLECGFIWFYLARYDLARFGLARFGLARFGLARFGLARFGLARLVWLGFVWPGFVWLGLVWLRFGLVSPGLVWWLFLASSPRERWLLSSSQVSSTSSALITLTTCIQQCRLKRLLPEIIMG
jgi:hypothetical protein